MTDQNTEEIRQRREKRIKLRRRRKFLRGMVKLLFSAAFVLILAGTLSIVINSRNRNKENVSQNEKSISFTNLFGKNVTPIEGASMAFKDLPIKEEFLDVNKYSRPQTELTKVNGIVVHYTGNPGTDAESNRNYFQSLGETGETYASSHFIVDLDGDIIQCIPLNEISYASNERNNDTISIECCHPDESGEFTTETYNNLVELVAQLCNYYGLDTNDVIRHYDVTGKICPKYYVENPEQWDMFLGFVDKRLDEL